jgi:hypothetical protein
MKTINNGDGSSKFTDQVESNAPMTNHPPAKIVHYSCEIRIKARFTVG